MIILFHRSFEKLYKKQTVKIKIYFKEKLALFAKDEFDLMLNNHPLQGKYLGYRSINITGDIRAVYKKLDSKSVVFVAIGSHSHLYK